QGDLPPGCNLRDKLGYQPLLASARHVPESLAGRRLQRWDGKQLTPVLALYLLPASPSSRTSSGEFGFRPSSVPWKARVCTWMPNCRSRSTPNSDGFFRKTNRTPLTCRKGIRGCAPSSSQ